MQAKNVSDNDGGDDDNSNEYMKTSCRCVLQDTRLRILRLPGTGKMRRSEPAAFVKNVMKMVERIIEKCYTRTGKMRRSEPAAALCEECYDYGVGVGVRVGLL